MPAITCPGCGEDEDLAGTRLDEETLRVTCNACGVVWGRSTAPRCRLCGSTDLASTPKPLWEKARGNQRTPAGFLDAWRCWTCGGRDVTSDEPIPGPPDHVASRTIDDT